MSLAANIAAAPSSATRTGFQGRARLQGHEAETETVQGNGSNGTGCEDPLLERARQADDLHRKLHQRPISAESLRKELRSVNSSRSAAMS